MEIEEMGHVIRSYEGGVDIHAKTLVLSSASTLRNLTTKDEDITGEKLFKLYLETDQFLRGATWMQN